MYMCIYIYIYMYMYIHTYIHTCSTENNKCSGKRLRPPTEPPEAVKPRPCRSERSLFSLSQASTYSGSAMEHCLVRLLNGRQHPGSASLNIVLVQPDL